MSQVTELKDDLKEAKKQARAVAKDHAELVSAVKDAIAMLKSGGGTSAEPVAEWAFRDAAKGAGASQNAAVIAELEAAIGIEPTPAAPPVDTAAVEGADAPPGQP